MSNLNIDDAVEWVKILADNNRCDVCDHLIGAVVRYPCGHCVCKTCVLSAEECLRCVSPPTISTNFTDVPYSQRIKHVSELLTTFQDLFQLDVYKRHRLSDKLKLEKQLFPQCIQAPVKYCNKRKSLNIVANDKENLRKSVLPGELIPNAVKMDQTINYVQQWLNKNESSLRKSNTNLPRKPFADINVNGQNNTKDQSLRLFNREINDVSISRKRTHIKVLDENKNLKHKRRKKKQELELQHRPQEGKKISETVTSKCENDESGIVIDDSIIIDDTQSAYVDKDKHALKAIRKAEGLNSYDNTNYDLLENNSKLNIITEPINSEKNKSSVCKTPFYKKSFLYKFCNECQFETLKSKNNSGDFIVLIDSKSYTTTIKLTQSHSNIKVKSVEVQSDNIYENKNTINYHSQKTETKRNVLFSPKHKENPNNDLFKKNMGTLCNASEKNENIIQITEDGTISKRVKNVVIEDSDSGSDVINSGSHSLVVTADVHKPFDDLGVLSELEPNELENRTRHAVRGHTPLSTDSSDKENYDPNRKKRQKSTKKYCAKK